MFENEKIVGTIWNNEDSSINRLIGQSNPPLIEMLILDNVNIQSNF